MCVCVCICACVCECTVECVVYEGGGGWLLLLAGGLGFDDNDLPRRTLWTTLNEIRWLQFQLT
jgi:hypothetical protein